MTSSEMPSRMPMSCPFASRGETTTIGNVSDTSLNFPDGFPSVYSSPASLGGKYVTRADINAIGHIATNDLFYHKCGGINTFDTEFATAINGYPKGAILDYYNGYEYVKVISLVDNNMSDFRNGIIDDYWMKLNQPDNNLASYYLKDQSVTLAYSINSFNNIYTFVAKKDGIITATINNFEKKNYSYQSGTSSNYISGSALLFKIYSSTATTITPPAFGNSSTNTLYNGYSVLNGLPTGQAIFMKYSSTTRYPDSILPLCKAGDIINIVGQNGPWEYDSGDYQVGYNLSFNLSISIN